MADFVPNRDADIGPWVTNLENTVKLAPANYGLVAADVVPLTNALATWNTDFPAHLAGQATAASLKQAKDATLAILIDAVRTLVRKMVGSGMLSPAEAADLQLTVPDPEPTPVGAPTETPLLRLRFGDRGRIASHFGPNPDDESNNGLPEGAVGAVIQFVEGAGPPANEDDWNWLGNDSNSPYVHNVGGTTPRTFTYRCAYINRKNEQGPWSAPQTATSTP